MYTEIHRGSFTSDGEDRYIPLVTDVDWMNVYNMTAAAAGPTASNMIKFYWQRGMADNDAYFEGYKVFSSVWYADTAANLSVGGFSLYNSSDDSLTSPIALTAISSGTPPVVATGTTTGLVDGNIVRLSSCTGANQFMGIDFEVGTVTPSTNFQLVYAPTIVAASSPGANAVWRKLKFDARWYPRKRYISAITRGTSTIIKFTVTHDFEIGMKVRFNIPAVRGSSAWGTVELDKQIGSVTAINIITNTITVDIDSSGYSAFAWPLTATDRFSAATCSPVGEDSNAFDYTNSEDAMINLSARGIILAGGASSPGGHTGDVMFWTAGKSNL